jgi:iron complex outermembrane receptor protein
VKALGCENSFSETTGLKRLWALATDLVISRGLLFTLCCGLAVPALGGRARAGEAPRVFDVPAGEAAETLRLAARQGGLEIIFFAESVRGIHTPALHGEFLPRAALDHLIAGTGLVLVDDPPHLTLTVHRRSLPAGDIAQRPAPPPPTMTKKTLFSTIRAWLAFALVPAVAARAADGSPLTGVVQGRVENSASGDFIGNVRVTVEGSALETLTNPFGEYRLENVPLGARTIRVAISGYGTRSAAVQVGTEMATANFSLVPEMAGRVDPNQTVVLEAFVVESQRTMSGSSVALNERRAAMNLKNVVAADEFGDSAEGNVAEFVKHMPGLSIDYNNADARYVSVRGLPSFGTAVMIDGNRMASAADNFSRGAEFNQVSLNNMAYIEVTKSPLPDTPADTVGGSVNMVLKSAFERSRPILNYKLNLNSNLSHAQGTNLFTLRDSPNARGSVSTLKPGFELNYINPLSKTLGFSLSLLNSNQYSPSATVSPSWRPVASGTALAPADQPFLGSVLLSDRPREGYRWSAGASVDWRVTPRDVLSVGAQANRFETILDFSDITFNAVASAVRPTSYDATQTVGAATGGRVTRSLTTYHKFMEGYNVSLTYRHNGPTWTLASGSAFSFSRTFVKSAEDGVIKTLNLQSPLLSVRFAGINDSIPARISTANAAGAPVAFGDLAGYTIQSATEGTPQNYLSKTLSGYANVSRWVRVPVPVKVKLGVDARREERDATNPTATLTFVGPDGIANTADDLAGNYDLVAEGYSRVNMPFGLGPIQRPSPRKAFALLQAHPEYFRRDEAGVISSTATQSREFFETVASGYARADTALLSNRLKLAGGVRYEHTFDEGRGALNDPGATYQRGANGKLILDAAGRPIKLPLTAVELVRLQYQERGARGERDYGNLFPSGNVSYALAERWLLRAAFAQTITRPQITSVIPSTTVTDPASTAVPTITVNNAGLKPWSSKNYDVALEYYFDKPGLISLGAFRKDIRDFFGSTRQRATPELLAEYGFDDSYLSYDIATRENVGNARVTGVEMEYRQTLTALPHWARGVSVFTNVTALRVQGQARADFSGFIGRTANWGLTLSRPRFTAKLNWNYRGRQRAGAVTGTNVPDGTYSYASPRLSTDVNLEVRLTRHATLFANVRNLMDIAWRNEIYGPATPTYARISNWVEYGPQVLMGIKGSF